MRGWQGVTKRKERSPNMQGKKIKIMFCFSTMYKNRMLRAMTELDWGLSSGWEGTNSGSHRDKGESRMIFSELA